MKGRPNSGKRNMPPRSKLVADKTDAATGLVITCLHGPTGTVYLMLVPYRTKMDEAKVQDMVRLHAHHWTTGRSTNYFGMLLATDMPWQEWSVLPMSTADVDDRVFGSLPRAEDYIAQETERLLAAGKRCINPLRAAPRVLPSPPSEARIASMSGRRP